jgi:hypothetical protein
MFTHAVDLPFATAEAPPALREAFGELREAVRPLARDEDPEMLTETSGAGCTGTPPPAWADSRDAAGNNAALP